MDRFYFHIEYGQTFPDEEGTELPDIAAARNAAVSLLGEMLKDDGDKFWTKPNITITVTDASGLVLWTLETVGMASSAVNRAHAPERR